MMFTVSLQNLNDTCNDDFNPNNAINQLLDKFSNLTNQHAPSRPQTRKRNQVTHQAMTKQRNFKINLN